jgi:hypothetical protein
MSVFTTILFWSGIVLMFDGSLALLFHERWQRVLRGFNIQRIALIEIGFACVLLAVHFLMA